MLRWGLRTGIEARPVRDFSCGGMRMPSLELGALAAAVPGGRLAGALATPITGIAYDSRRVRPGDLFCAVKGFVHDGRAFVPEAVGRGAAAVLVGLPGLEADPGVPVLLVPDDRWAMALAAAEFFGHPSQRLALIGVTGTNGKTTTTHLIRAVLQAAGAQVGLMGTIHTLIGDEELPVVHTTPEAPDLQELLARMVAAGCTHAVMEVSSHSLELGRVGGCEFAAAALTNVTQDHLDFHKTMEAYWQAKAKLFAVLGTGGGAQAPRWPGLAAFNADDPTNSRVARFCRVPAVWYGQAATADVRAGDIRVEHDGVAFTVTVAGQTLPVRLRLTGRFNVANALAALAVTCGLGVPAVTAVGALEAVRGVPGRFERVDAGQDFTVIVDYAHTPDGLENVLGTAREIAAGRLWVVFGCGGDRDRGKRPLMGAIAARLADRLVLTSDNPRSEDPEAILRDIAAGIPVDAAAHASVVADRRAAIAAALAGARAGDVVVVAGKGHETYQVFADRTVPFDDRQAIRDALAELGWSGG